jgi:hypothetical protein
MGRFFMILFLSVSLKSWRFYYPSFVVMALFYRALVVKATGVIVDNGTVGFPGEMDFPVF